MQFSATVNRFIVKAYLNSTFTNDLKRKKKIRKISKVTEYAALTKTPVVHSNADINWLLKTLIPNLSLKRFNFQRSVGPYQGPNCLRRYRQKTKVAASKEELIKANICCQFSLPNTFGKYMDSWFFSTSRGTSTKRRLTLCILMGSSYWFDTLNLDWSILYI